jgi:glyoxylase-like metal-dependent hydrolase (beta-lactamase superfamily II)
MSISHCRYLSHSHWDHIGNTELFPLTTALVVGPGTQAHVRPGRPLSLRSHPMESEFVGRKVVEIEFAESDPVLLGLKMHDFFGDGSFYLVEAPGVSCGSLVLVR